MFTNNKRSGWFMSKEIAKPVKNCKSGRRHAKKQLARAGKKPGLISNHSNISVTEVYQ
jgi:hypothetical protein